MDQHQNLRIPCERCASRCYTRYEHPDIISHIVRIKTPTILVWTGTAVTGEVRPLRVYRVLRAR